jgi:hypothetical protein
MLLTTGAISIINNGQEYYVDYGLTNSQLKDASVSWATSASCDPMADIKGWQDAIEDSTGVRPTRAVMSRKTLNYLLRADKIVKSVFVLSNGVATLSERILRAYLMEELGLQYEVYSKKYLNENKQPTSYMPDDTFVLFPEGPLGKTWHGTTPEESDLLTGSAANVAIVDTGVAVTTIKHEDPVTVETKVSMIAMPSFEQIDKLVIADVTP